MTQAAHLSPIQYVHQPDGRITVEGLPNVNIHTIAEQGAVQGRNWPFESAISTRDGKWRSSRAVRGSNPGFLFSRCANRRRIP